MPSYATTKSIIAGNYAGPLIASFKTLTVSGAATLSGAVAIAGALTVSGATTLTGTLTQTGQSVEDGGSQRAAPITPTANISLTVAGHSGRTILCNSLCRTVTLPLAVSTARGDYNIVNAFNATAVATELRVLPASADLMNEGTSGLGLALQSTVDAVGDHVHVESDQSAGYYTVSLGGTWVAST